VHPPRSATIIQARHESEVNGRGTLRERGRRVTHPAGELLSVWQSALAHAMIEQTTALPQPWMKNPGEGAVALFAPQVGDSALLPLAACRLPLTTSGAV
jgi:hypothetical protein